MSEVYSFEIAVSALKSGARQEGDFEAKKGVKYKDCSSKFNKVEATKEAIEEAKREISYAARASRAAMDEYNIWKNDPRVAEKYRSVWVQRHAEWTVALAKRADLEKKLIDVEQDAFQCDAKNIGW